MRPEFLADRAFQRTSYLAGEIDQLDWWHTGVRVPVGNRAAREAFGLVATLPDSGAHAVVFTLGLTMADFLAALPACLARLGGVPEKAVCDNDGSIFGRLYGPVAAAYLRDRNQRTARGGFGSTAHRSRSQARTHRLDDSREAAR